MSVSRYHLTLTMKRLSSGRLWLCFATKGLDNIDHHTRDDSICRDPSLKAIFRTIGGFGWKSERPVIN